ncbi:polymorphic toxin-type HINT domain-containing protein [Nonomuraea sediminis]|uniref:polymorphic toxin-type HINT domain-containing protein n=1 Tax=Nonomuraea sediminis TaxID=2835864 RepID=UPI001BDBEDA7|nr:polymorphic toxin-type HINT domain-containing protein [Nonomuraea sediminis]
MRVRRVRVWLVALVVALVATLLVSGVGVPEPLVEPASAAGPDPERSVDGQPLPQKKTVKGAEETTPKVSVQKPVWPKPGTATVTLPEPGKVTDAGALPVKVGQAKGGSPGKVKVETLAPDAVRALGGVGLAAQLVRADSAGSPGTVRAEFSYAAFRDAFGGNFADRLQLVRLPACVLQSPRPRDCVVRPTVVKAINDLKAGTLTAEVEAAPTNAAPAQVKPFTRSKDAKTNAARALDAALATQLAAGSVYLLATALTGPGGNWGATDLKPSGTWQAGTSGGGFDYDVPLPEAPTVAGDGPDLSLQYDASSVDGQGDWTNNQSSPVGAGWDLNAGFIERRYARCQADNYNDPDTADLIWTATEAGSAGRALCWESPDANDNDPSTNDMTQSELLLNAGGKSARIVKDATSGAYKTVPDLGWRLEQVTGGANGQPYWKVTNQQGQVWRFGYTADAQWQVPYIGNDAGEPCYDKYQRNDTPPTCTGVWRWNLDQEVDRNENVTDYSYTPETNYFCMPSCAHEIYRVLPYTSGGVLAQVRWGSNSQVAGSVPTARTTFTTVDRDVADWPSDMRCTQQVGCANGALAFFATKKLTSVLAESLNPSSGSWEQVDRLDLRQTWINQRTDFGPPSDPALWLDTVQETGLAASPSITLPPEDFDAVMLAGAMDYTNTSDWPQQLSWRMVPRIAAIGNGMGGRIEVTYGQADPCGGGKGRDGSNYFADKTGDCYDKDKGSDPGAGYESWTRYFKQLATKVVERDMVGGSPDMVHAYEFVGSPRWANPIQFAQPNLAPNASDWRGYQTVRTVEGSGTDPSAYSVNTKTFLRGTGETVTTFDGATITDVQALQGYVLQEQEWKMTALSPRAYTEVSSTRHEYTVQNTGNGPGTLDPAFILRTRDRSRELVTGGTWRYTDERTAYNADGLPIKVNDYGQDGITTDNSCISTTYARNTDPGQYLVDFPAIVEKHAGDDCVNGALIGKTVTLYDLGTDPATNKPSDGNVTEARAYADASTVSTAKATFDEYGRPLTATDPLGKTTRTTYTPAVGWPKDGITITNPLGHTSTAKLSHLLGDPISAVDANGKTIEADYDALGRATTLWRPGQPRSGGTPTATVSYAIPWDGSLGQPTAPIKTTAQQLLTGSGTSAKWLTTASYDDGLGRTRESQAASPAGGRIVTVTAYDPRGLTLATSDPVYNSAAPGSGLLNPVLTDLPQWTKTVYDDQERPTAAISYHLGAELRRTTTAYPGLDRTEVTPPVGAKTATITDAYDRTIKVEEWADATTHNDTSYSYDLNGNPTSTTDANGNVRTTTFDWLGRRTAASDPDAGRSTYGYDLAGQLTWSINGKGQKVSHSYDDLGRHTTLWSGDVGTGTKLAEWTFDTVAKGQPTASTRYVGGQAYTDTVTAYDDDYHSTASKTTIPASEGNLAGDYAFISSYDAAGNLREETLPAAGGLPVEKLTHTYTDLGFVRGLTSDLGGGFTYLKDTALTPTGQLASRQLGGNGQIKRTAERDASTDWLSRVTTQTKADTASPQTVQDDRYSYDLGGQITRVLDAASAIPGTTDGQSECFAYDGLLHLKTAYTTTASSCTGTGDGQGIDPYNQAYSYDKVGNLTSLTDNGQTATYTYPTPGATAVRPNAVTSITRPTGTDSYTYDNSGQLTTRTVGGKQGTFNWNELGQLTSATVDGQQTSMIYDADGDRLIRRDPDGSSTLYLGSTELKLSGGLVAGKRYYSSADGAQIAMRDATGVTWLLSGSHGSTQLAINDTTGTVNRERYLPYGQRRGSDDLPFTDRGFLGKIEDAATGLNYLGARYYDPTIAKFISTDPELDPRKPEWANPYSYAGNNPIGLSDPDGLRVDAGGGRDPDAGRRANTTFDQTHYGSGKKKTRERINNEVKNHTTPYLSEMSKKPTKGGKPGKPGSTSTQHKLPTLHLDCVGSGGHKACDPVPEFSPLQIGVFTWLKKYYDATKIAGACVQSKYAKECEQSINDLAGPTIINKLRRLSECNSFSADTEILMADGTHERIDKIQNGDKVVATDPDTGKTAIKNVVALHKNRDTQLADVTVLTETGQNITIYTTQQHPFWDETRHAWVEAADLTPGDRLRTLKAATLVVEVRTFSGSQDMYNLTVAGIHTYYVLAGAAPVLVHNTKCPHSNDIGAVAQKRAEEILGKRYPGGKMHTQFEIWTPHGVRRVDIAGENSRGGFDLYEIKGNGSNYPSRERKKDKWIEENLGWKTQVWRFSVKCQCYTR